MTRKQLQRLVDAAIHFEFGDAGDCYEREVDGRMIWEVRKVNVGAWWVTTKAEALAEFGIGGEPRGPRDLPSS